MYRRWGKRAFDVLGAALGLILAAPLLVLAAAAIRLSMGPPVLFRQERAGLHGRPFLLLKLRSMRPGPGEDAERLTPLGRLLRATAIDELPQLINVLRGEMSLVGPRPLPLSYLPLFDERQRRRLAVRPGLCGLAQAAGRNAVPWARRLRLDQAYLRRISFRRDLAIIAACLRVVLTGRGVSAPGHATMPRFPGAGG
ncbi:MAG: sugar transferase [Rhodovarius sp.]|nr:sugar transferase [Rhodovarius sp.]MCX7931013.1 sugar transferase [Rhodovarius sp.]MDW8315348.1 sugar transferase [Rhodovarius sp.]